MSLLTTDRSFGGCLKRFRISGDIGVRELARILCMDPGNYSKIESSILPPPNSATKVIALLKPLKLQKTDVKYLVHLAYWHHLNKFNEEWEFVVGSHNGTAK